MSTDSTTVHAEKPGLTGPVTPRASDVTPRASDAERADTVARLHEALGAGRLDLAETDERVAAGYAARYRHELTALLADLPRDDTSFTDAPTWTALWMLAVWRARTAVTGTAGPRPTSSQQRTATVLTVMALVWMAACAVVGALVVGA